MSRTAAQGRLKKSEITRRTILDAAARVLREKAYADVKLSDIATAAGMQAGSLYYHFASREDIVEQILIDGVDRVFFETVARVEAMPKNADPRDKFECAICTHLETMHEVSDYVGATIRIINQVPQALVSARRERRRAYLDYWRKLFREAEDAGIIRPGVNISVCRMLLMGMLNWSSEWFRKEGLSATEVGRQAAHMLMDGIMRPRQSKPRVKQPSLTEASTARPMSRVARVSKRPSGRIDRPARKK